MTIDRKTPPAIHDAVEFEYKLPPITQDALSNGLPLYWLSAGVQEVVQVDWLFPAGIWYEEQPAVAQAVAALMKNGTAKRTAHEINEALEFYGASLKVNAGSDFSTVSLHTLTKHLPKLLPIVFEVLTEATFAEDELAIYKQNAVQKLLVNLRECEFVANQKIDAALFGEAHPYGRFTRRETLEALEREQLLAFCKNHFAMVNMKIFMAGKVGKQEVQYLDEVFGKAALTPGVLHTPQPPVAEPTARAQRIINDEKGVQGAIRIARRFPNRHHEDFAPMVVLNTLFGGYFGSRLMANIREDKGYTYGIYSSLEPYINGGSMSIHTEAGRDVLDAAVKEVYREMELLCNEPADAEELLLVKNYLLGNMLGDLDGPFSILHRWRTLIVNDLTEAHFNRNINIYKTITAAELQALAQKYYKPEDFLEVVVI